MDHISNPSVVCHTHNFGGGVVCYARNMGGPYWGPPMKKRKENVLGRQLLVISTCLYNVPISEINKSISFTHFRSWLLDSKNKWWVKRTFKTFKNLPNSAWVWSPRENPTSVSSLNTEKLQISVRSNGVSIFILW